MDAQRKTDQDAEDGDGEEVSRLVGLHRAIQNDPTRKARWAAWQAENAEAIADFNRWYEKNGHPLAAYMTPLDGAV